MTAHFITESHGAFAQTSHVSAAHHGHGFIDTLLRGFAWRTGSDVASNVFHMAPGLITVAVLAVLVFLGVRWLHSRRS